MSDQRYFLQTATKTFFTITDKTVPTKLADSWLTNGSEKGALKR